MIYKASLDKTALVVTIGVSILFAVIIGGQYSIIKDAENATPIYTTVGLLLIYTLAFAFSPTGYIITADEIMIRRPLTNVRIKRVDIERVELVEEQTMNGALRTFGVGGLFGYYGGFANTSIGRMTWYATRKDTAVLLRTVNDKKIILTPNERQQFVNHLNS
ncbi:PH domain-containing protein [Pedobacter xixiisoli]|uniref:PH domain-containing protein n=1 Tax=Pedobacter xixiisoli TaxID=1476464 RepID=A0A285ZQE0_9SPHI|nr:PH domain-containing protein [Pedobacter xixiisoli]SOD11871.1 PH domain-containing protein [Pedobacter xixiisoli]